MSCDEYKLKYPEITYAMPTAIMKYSTSVNPNSSTAINKEDKGQFVTPQKTHTIPIAAQSIGLNPHKLPNRQPNVAPTKKAGMISPPL
jgi:hypothetical protein